MEGEDPKADEPNADPPAGFAPNPEDPKPLPADGFVIEPNPVEAGLAAPKAEFAELDPNELDPKPEVLDDDPKAL